MWAKVVEPTGPDTMVVVKVGEQLLSARLGPKHRPRPGETLRLGVDAASINLFDPETENRI